MSLHKWRVTRKYFYRLFNSEFRHILFGVEVSRPRVWMMFLSRFIVGAGTGTEQGYSIRLLILDALQCTGNVVS